MDATEGNKAKATVAPEVLMSPDAETRIRFSRIDSKTLSQASRSIAASSVKHTSRNRMLDDTSTEQLLIEEELSKRRVAVNVANFDKSRRQIISDAKQIHKTIHTTLLAKTPFLDKDGKVLNFDTGKTFAELLSSNQIGNISKSFKNKSLPMVIAGLGQTFFEDPMIDDLTAKAKGNKKTIAPSEKFLSIEAKYKKVQRDINQIVADAISQKDKAKLEKDTLERFKNVRRQANDLRTNITLGFDSLNKVAARVRLKKSDSFAHLRDPKSHNRPPKPNVAGDKSSLDDTNNISKIVDRTKSEEKDQLKLRRRIDRLYINFAKTGKYRQLYDFSKEKLKHADQNFLADSSKPLYFPELEDYFVTGENMRYISPSILMSPLIHTYLATNSKRFVRRDSLDGSQNENLVT